MVSAIQRISELAAWKNQHKEDDPQNGDHPPCAHRRVGIVYCFPRDHAPLQEFPALAKALFTKVNCGCAGRPDVARIMPPRGLL